MNQLLFAFPFALVETLLIFWMAISMLTCRFSKGKCKAALLSGIAVGTILVGSINQLQNPVKQILLLVIFSVLIQIIFSEPLYKKLFFLILVVYSLLVCDLIIGNLASGIISANIAHILNSLPSLLSISVITKLINVVLVALTIHFFRKIHFNISKKYWIVMDFIIILFVVILESILYLEISFQQIYPSSVIYVALIAFAFLVLSILTLYFFGKICSFYEQQHQNEIFDLKWQELNGQLVYQESYMNTLRKMRHDINRYLADISLLLHQGQAEEAQGYIQDITGALKNIEQVINTGNNVLDVILNYRLALCKKEQIDLEITCDTLPPLKIQPMYLSAALSNLLDNAIEAVQKLPLNKRKIQVQLFCYKNFFTITVKNPYEQALKMDDGLPQTSKEDSTQHGVGLLSVKTAVEMYQGSFKVFTQNHIFIAIAMFLINTGKDE